MKIKTSELIGDALDWAVCEAQRCNTTPLIVYEGNGRKWIATEGGFTVDYSNWSQGGPIIEREGINLSAHYKIHTGEWQAWCEHGPSAYGPTPLIAAMRCLVARKLGDEVDVPDELCK